VRGKEDGCDLQRAVDVRELSSQSSSLGILSGTGFWVVRVFFKLIKSPVFTLG